MKYPGLASLVLMTMIQSTHAGCLFEDDEVEHRYCAYVGAGVNYSYLRPDASGTNWKVTDENSRGYEIYAGLRLTRHWYGEISYADLGSSGLMNRNPAVEGTHRITYKIPTVWAQYRVFGDQGKRPWDLFLRTGLSFMSNSSNHAVLPYQQQTSLQIPVGVALKWNPDDALGVRLRFDSYNTDAFTIGFSVVQGF